ATTSDFHELRLFDFGTRNWQTLARFNVIDNPTWSADSSYIYFNSKGKPNVLDNRLMAPAVYRFDLLHRQLQRLLDLTALDVLNSPWYGIEPDGTLLAARVHSLHELYRLDLKW